MPCWEGRGVYGGEGRDGVQGVWHRLNPQHQPDHVQRLRLLASDVLRSAPSAAVGDELVPQSKDIMLTDEDVARLREKYRVEREKRQELRPEGNAQ